MIAGVRRAACCHFYYVLVIVFMPYRMLETVTGRSVTYVIGLCNS